MCGGGRKGCIFAVYEENAFGGQGGGGDTVERLKIIWNWKEKRNPFLLAAQVK